MLQIPQKGAFHIVKCPRNIAYFAKNANFPGSLSSAQKEAQGCLYWEAALKKEDIGQGAGTNKAFLQCFLIRPSSKNTYYLYHFAYFYMSLRCPLGVSPDAHFRDPY